MMKEREEEKKLVTREMWKRISNGGKNGKIYEGKGNE